MTQEAQTTNHDISACKRPDDGGVETYQFIYQIASQASIAAYAIIQLGSTR